jgi:hypothetical protein
MQDRIPLLSINKMGREKLLSAYSWISLIVSNF